MTITTTADVIVSGNEYTADGRTIRIVATPREDGITDYTVRGRGGCGPDSSLAGPWTRRGRAVEAVYTLLCPEDPAVPSTRAAMALTRTRDAVRIAASNAAWAKALACGEPEST